MTYLDNKLREQIKIYSEEAENDLENGKFVDYSKVMYDPFKDS